jgi:hypothetical protein
VYIWCIERVRPSPSLETKEGHPAWSECASFPNTRVRYPLELKTVGARSAVPAKGRRVACQRPARRLRVLTPGRCVPGSSP